MKIASENHDYQYYKLGFKYYKKINPNFIYKRKGKTAFVLKPAEELAASLNEILQSIQLSMLYFSKLINEYPDSIWRNDAKAKIKLLQKIKNCYENIDPTEKKVVDSAGFVKEMGLKI